MVGDPGEVGSSHAVLAARVGQRQFRWLAPRPNSDILHHGNLPSRSGEKVVEDKRQSGFTAAAVVQCGSRPAPSAGETQRSIKRAVVAGGPNTPRPPGLGIGTWRGTVNLRRPSVNGEDRR